MIKWTDWVQAVGSIATAIALFVALFAAWISQRSAQVAKANAAKTAEQNEEFVGALSAIAWREQVFNLHDRGLTPGQIRFIMHLENGGAGYEGTNGRIDDIVDKLPRTTALQHGAAGHPVDRPECPRMPSRRWPWEEGGCKGPCASAVRDSGGEDFRNHEAKLIGTGRSSS